MKPWLSVNDARKALQEGTGRAIKVAVLDSGIETDNLRLDGMALCDDLAIVDDGVQLQTVDGAGEDVYGHGTAVCDIIRRIAPEVEIGSFRVLGAQLRSRTLIIREGARLALERGYHIMNCSFGCARHDHVLQYKDWVDEAYIRGRHIVAACNNQDFTKLEWPGHFPTVITVNSARTDQRDALYFQPGHLVEFFARGDGLEVAWAGGGQKTVTGSSFAAPHVTGLLARLLSKHPNLPPLEAKALLRQLAEPWEGEAEGE